MSARTVPASRPHGPRRAAPRYLPERLEPRTLLAAGALDPTFDGDGVLQTPFRPVIDLNDGVRHVAVQSDGRIVAAGYTGDHAFAELARYLPDGRLDPGFGTGGQILTPGFSTVSELIVLPDGDLLIVGTEHLPQVTGVLVARYDPNGQLDPSFGQAGVARLQLPSSGIGVAGAAVQRNGEIIIAGGVSGDVFLARLHPDGTPDTSFGDATSPIPGVTLLNVGESDRAADMAVVDDSIFVGGYFFRGDWFLARFTEDGRADTAFGEGDGVVQTDLLGTNESAYLMTVQGEKVVLAGDAYDAATQRRYFAIVRYNDDGSLDRSFDGDGKLLFPKEFAVDRLWHMNALTHDAIGNLLVGGSIITAIVRPDEISTAAGAIRFAVDGSRDQDFGQNGAAVVRAWANHSQAWAMGVTTDAGIVVAGARREIRGGNYASDFGVARFLTEGQADSGFGAGGQVTTNFTARVDSESAAANAAAQQTDGKLLFAGTMSVTPSGTHAGMMRLHATGSRDGSFGSAGEVRTTGWGMFSAVAPLPGGKTLTFGNANLQTRTGSGVTRFMPDGRVDTTFRSALLPIRLIDSGGSIHRARLAVQSDGKILLGGWFAWLDAPASPWLPFVARLNANGSHDATFGGAEGFVWWNDPGQNNVNDIFPLPDGRILVATSSAYFGEGRYAKLRRLLPDGRPDPTFGVGGTLAVSDPAGRAELQPDGRIVTVGRIPTPGVAGGYDLVLRRFNSDGSPDETFGTAGRVVADVGQTEFGKDLALQPDGSILVGGDEWSANSFFLARLTPAGALDPAFGDAGVARTTVGANTLAAGVLLQSDGKALVYGSADRKITAVRYHTDATPRVHRVFVSAGHWAAQFREALAADGNGSGTHGYAVTDDSAPLPWTGLNAISIEFDRAADVERDDLQMTAAGGDILIDNFRYDPATRTATWTLGRRLGAEPVRLELDTDGPEDFVRTFNVLPGDVTRSGRADSADFLQVRNSQVATVTTPNWRGVRYEPANDVNGDGRVSVLDLALVRRHLNSEVATPVPVPAPARARAPALSPAASLLDEE